MDRLPELVPRSFASEFWQELMKLQGTVHSLSSVFKLDLSRITLEIMSMRHKVIGPNYFAMQKLLDGYVQVGTTGWIEITSRVSH